MNYILDIYRRWFLKGPTARGESNTSFIKAISLEYQWQKTRKAHIAIDPVCNMCSASKEAEVHHIRPWHLFADLRFNHENLITLCRPCHFRFGHGRNWKKWNPLIKDFSVASKPFLANIKDNADE